MTASNKSLLVIDDDPSVLQLIKLLMGPLVKEIWTSLDPHEGLRLAMAHKPALILLDNHMQEMLGIEVLERLRRIPSLAATPVIMMTADSTIETVRKAADNQVQGYLLKPCDPDLLLEKVSPWLALDPAERSERELCAELQLTPEQEHQLDMRCLTQVLGVIVHELNLLTLGSRDPEALKTGLSQLQSFRQALGKPPPRIDLFGQFDKCEAEVFRQMGQLWQNHPDFAASQQSGSEDNLRTLFRILRQRSHELMGRLGNPLGWKFLPLEQLRPQLACPLEAARNNSLTQYQTRYNDLEKLLTEYSVQIEMRGSERDKLQLPLAMVDVLRDLAGWAYHQTPTGGSIRLSLIEDRRSLTLKVADGGQGLSTAQLKKISESGPGETELLKACHLTRKLGGKIWLSSQPGSGSEIRIEIPFRQGS